MNNKVYGYARCSTNDIKQDIEYQRRELKKLGVAKENIFFEYESGAKDNRIELNRLFDVAEQCSTIVSTEVSRLTRSTKKLCEIIEKAKDKHLKLIIGGFTVDCTGDKLDPMTEGMLKMMGVFAEMEREMTSQRVKSGMANAKEKGVVLGRPIITINNIPLSFIKHYPKYKNKQVNVTEFARICDVSRQTIYKYIRIYETV